MKFRTGQPAWVIVADQDQPGIFPIIVLSPIEPSPWHNSDAHRVMGVMPDGGDPFPWLFRERYCAEEKYGAWVYCCLVSHMHARAADCFTPSPEVFEAARGVFKNLPGVAAGIGLDRWASLWSLPLEPHGKQPAYVEVSVDGLTWSMDDGT